jgi:hypothetical protein
MKRVVLFAFTLASTVVFILGAGPAKSQDKKEVRRTIIINNSDTIINGKKLSKATPAERKALLKELKDSEKNIKARKAPGKRSDDQEIIIRQGDKGSRVFRWRSDDEGKRHAGVFNFDGDSLMMSFGDDSLMKEFRLEIDGLDSNLRKGVITMNRSFRRSPELPRRPEGPVFMGEPGLFNRIPSRRENSQTFNYVNTDKDGISSRMSIRISEASEEIRKKIQSGSDKSTLTVNDLTLAPNFSNGKLNLIFSLSEKGAAEIKILDTNLKEVFSDRPASVNGTYFKQINLPKNGIYYIRISQGNKTFLRQMVKE